MPLNVAASLARLNEGSRSPCDRTGCSRTCGYCRRPLWILYHRLALEAPANPDGWGGFRRVSDLVGVPIDADRHASGSCPIVHLELSNGRGASQLKRKGKCAQVTEREARKSRKGRHPGNCLAPGGRLCKSFITPLLFARIQVCEMPGRPEERSPPGSLFCKLRRAEWAALSNVRNR
jgi:hypothetical protein